MNKQLKKKIQTRMLASMVWEADVLKCHSLQYKLVLYTKLKPSATLDDIVLCPRI